MKMNRLFFKFSLMTTFFSTLFLIHSGYACTEIMTKAKDGSVIVGRTLEFGPDLKTNVITSPRDKLFQTKSPDGKEGLSWTSKYGYLFMDFFGVHQTLDGMNEKGLSFGYLYLPGYAEYQKINSSKDHRALSYLFFGDWVLGNFSTVEQVKEAVKNINVFAKPENIGSYKNMIFPLHAIITDASGKSITIEFVKGKIKVYDNFDGVMTNSPTYHWQLTNLKNYTNLTPYFPTPVTIHGISYSGTGQGAGSVGLPGDFTPPSRFVKASFLEHSAYPVKNAVDALNLSQHIINNVDIPNGVVRGIKGSNSPSDTTQWTVFKDLTHHVLYFKSYANLSLQAIDMNQLNFSKGAKQLETPISTPQIIDNITSNYMKTKLK